jgi:glycosyltransferase involved in cell wall biosynthesis
VIDALAGHGHEVTVLGYRRPGSAAPELPGEVCVGVRPIETADAGRRRAVGWMARALVERAPYSSAKYRSRAYDRAVRAALARRPAAVFVDHAQSGFAVRHVNGLRPPLVFLAHNAEGDMYAKAVDGSGSRRWANRREARRIGAMEAHLARRARQVWVLTDDDARYFRELCPDADIRTLEVASMIADGPSPGPPSCDVALIGTWNWGPNAKGLEWFSADVVPLLPPAMRVEVAGAGAEWLVGRHANVSVRGFVPDANAFMSAARVVAVPSVAGGGVQVKTLDAVACGVPVVATRMATRGIEGLPESVAVTDDAAEFAASLERLAVDADREGLRKEALEWSRARREQLAATVAGHVSELTEAAAEPVRA